MDYIAHFRRTDLINFYSVLHRSSQQWISKKLIEGMIEKQGPTRDNKEDNTRTHW